VWPGDWERGNDLKVGEWWGQARKRVTKLDGMSLEEFEVFMRE
jgi:hypothetical protein